MNALSENDTDQVEEQEEQTLTKDEESKCTQAFHAFDKDNTGFLTAPELKTALEMMGQKATEEEVYRMINAADEKNSGRVNLEQFKKVICDHKYNQVATNEEDTLDAFISLGGDNDGGGSIDASKLISIIKKDFEMTIDIEKLIDEIDEDGSGEIEYEEFMTLLSASD